MSTCVEITPEEFDLLPNYGGASLCKPEHAHIYDAIAKLQNPNKSPAQKVALDGVESWVASKKAHCYARARGFRVRTKTKDGWLYLLRTGV